MTDTVNVDIAERPRATTSWIRIVFALLFLISIAGIQRDLWTPDEPREAEISREMLLAPSVVPTLNGESFIEKPPLYYWTVAAVFALTGEPSAAAARGVSMAASFLTLWVVFLWGRREISTGAGLAAALALATSVQFMISSHWVLIDPLLMLFMTLAAWAGWELVQGRGGALRALQFYLALTAALWTKGLIGPMLIGVGLLAYAAAMRSLVPIRRVYPLAGVAVLGAATAVLAGLIYLEAGGMAVREWFWVNHVQRFIDPDYTGHEQPWHYYLWTLPTAVFPWWAPLAATLRPASWRASASEPLRLYLGAMSAGMILLLSAAATKRGIYLLPLLPLLMLLFAAQAREWWQRATRRLARSGAWWFEVVATSAFALAPPLAGMLYLGTAPPLAVGFVLLVCAVAAALVVSTLREHRSNALRALGAQALLGVIGLMVVTAQLAAPQKDMQPFVAWLDAELPAGEPVYALGDLDETLYGIVPFATHRAVESIELATLDSVHPRYVLVQDKEGGRTAPDLGPAYERLRDRSFGPGRYFAIWRAREGARDGVREPSAQGEP